VAASYAKYLPRIERSIGDDLITLLRKVDPALAPRSASESDLGQIKDFASIATASQAEGKPMKDVSVGTPAQRAEAGQAFLEIAKKIIARIR
jgi:hypothetical protein